MIGFEQRLWLAPLKVLPSPTVTVMFQLADQFPGTPRAFVVGPRSSAETIFPVGATACVDVKLTPVGAARLFGPVLGDMIDQQVDLDVLLRGRRAAELPIDQLLEGTWSQRLLTVERFLIDRLGMATFVPPEVDWAWQAIRRSCGEVRVGRLIAETDWSHRHFVRQFRRDTGLRVLATACLSVRDPSTGGPAAVGGNGLAGDPVSVVTHQPGDQLRSVDRGGPATAGRALGHRSDRVRIGVAGVVRPGIHTVHGDASGYEVDREGSGELVDGGLGGDVGELVGHGAVVLPGGEQHDATARRTVVARRERLDEEERGPHVHRMREIDLGCGELFEGLGTAPGMVGHDHVEPAEGPVGGVDHGLGAAGIGCSKLFEQRLGAAGIGPPWLLGVVRRPGVEHHPGAIGHKPAGDSGPDGDPPTGPGHEHDSTLKCPLATGHPEDLHRSSPGGGDDAQPHLRDSQGSPLSDPRLSVQCGGQLLDVGSKTLNHRAGIVFARLLSCEALQDPAPRERRRSFTPLGGKRSKAYDITTRQAHRDRHRGCLSHCDFLGSELAIGQITEISVVPKGSLLVIAGELRDLLFAGHLRSHLLRSDAVMDRAVIGYTSPSGAEATTTNRCRPADVRPRTT